jgi:hypothetical protein
MSGKGELVNFTRLFKKGPLTSHDKTVLKEKIYAIIDAASHTITIEAMVEASAEDLKKALEEIERKKRKGKR